MQVNCATKVRHLADGHPFLPLRIGAGPIRTLTATFDGAGNRTSVLYPSGVSVTTNRDALDRAKTIATTGPKVCFGGSTPGVPCTNSGTCWLTGSSVFNIN